MSWQTTLLIYLSITVFLLLSGFWCLHWLLRRRTASIREELAGISGDMIQMIELQMEVFRKMKGSLADMEEMVAGLMIPSSEQSLPLERRYQVLALARRGLPVEEIAARLDVPRGEADLILRLRRYIDAQAPKVRPNGSLKRIAQA